MSCERQEKIMDAGQLAFGAPLFAGVAAVTGAVMLVGFVVVTAVDRVMHR